VHEDEIPGSFHQPGSGELQQG
jgi:hypothetical protein